MRIKEDSIIMYQIYVMLKIMWSQTVKVEQLNSKTFRKFPVPTKIIAVSDEHKNLDKKAQMGIRKKILIENGKMGGFLKQGDLGDIWYLSDGLPVPVYEDLNNNLMFTNIVTLTNECNRYPPMY